MRKCIFLFLLGILFSGNLTAQEADRFELSRSLPERLRGKVYKTYVNPQWEGDVFWYRNKLADGKLEYVVVDAQKGERRPAFDAKRLAQALSQATGKECDPERLVLDELRLSEDGTSMSFRMGAEKWVCNLENNTLSPAPKKQQGSAQAFSTRMRHSTRTGDEVYLTFENQLDYDLTLNWVNGDQEQTYATLRPGQDYQQHTFSGHIWRVADPQGQTLAVIEAGSDGDFFQFNAENVRLTLEASLQEKDAAPAQAQVGSWGRRGARSPDGAWELVVRENNVYLVAVASGEETALTQEGTPQDGYEPYGIFWAPDSKHVIVLKSTRVEERKIYLVESSPRDQLQPKLHTRSYAKPGDELPYKRPKLFSVETRSQIPVSEELQPQPWDLSEFIWNPNSQEFYYLYNQRGHQVMRLLGVNAQSGEVRVVVEETSPTFIDYSNKTLFHPLFESGELIWMSERDGWNHLYLYDLATGRVKKQLTSGSWVVRRIERMDDELRQIWLWAGGLYPEQDPYYLHLCRVNYDGTHFTKLTQADGTHSVEFSPNGKWFLDRYSRVDLPPVTELRRAEGGERVCELERGDWSELLATGWIPPERFVAKGRDGETDIYGVITRPTHFDPAQSYPIIEEIYAGPQGSFTQKTFAPETKRQALAELGFIVVQLDGMGTNDRGKKFHDVCWKNLGDAGFPDRILWIKAAAARYPYMDTNRVGIYGGSAGGQNSTRALLAYGDFYKVAVSDCGCHDNRMDKIWWNEAWMGWPVGPHYAEQSNVTQAHKLTGKLFLTVGELDDNVDPSSTMQVVHALIQANKDFEMLVIPGSNHGAGESPYADRKRKEFFVKHLL